MLKNTTPDLRSKLVDEMRKFASDKDLPLILTPELLQTAYDVYFDFSGYLTNGQVNELTRYSSWDICFKHFEEFFKKPTPLSSEDLRVAGLHLGFYLASWGMFRNPALLNSGIKKYESLAKKLHDLQKGNPDFKYTEIESFLNSLINSQEILVDENEKILDLDEKEKIKKSSDTLITKIMLGVYSDTPAFDRFFKKTVRKSYGKWQKKLTLEQKIDEIFDKIKVDGKENLKSFIQKKLKRKDKNLKEEKILDAIFFEIGRALSEAEKEIKSPSKHSE